MELWFYIFSFKVTYYDPIFESLFQIYTFIFHLEACKKFVNVLKILT